MKTKAQKQEDVKAAGEKLARSKTMVFTDFGRVTSEDMRKLRREMKAIGAELSVVKKRLLNVLFKEKGIDYDARQFEGPVGTVFAEGGLDTVAGTIHKFFAGLGADAKSKEESMKKILGAYDLEAKAPMTREFVMMVGKLPSREVLLGQLFGTIAAPIQAFMYILQQKSAQPQASAELAEANKQ